MENSKKIPSPCEWAGGVENFEKLTKVFYEKVLKDEILEPVFRHMAPEHAKHVAHFIAEVLMGPKKYSEEFGEQALHRMAGKHIGKHLTEVQRKRWVDLILATVDEIGMPNDPEFRSTLVGHLEWGTRVAMITSHLPENPITPEDHIPQWGWGEAKGPYEIVGSLFQQQPEEKK